MKPGIDIDVGTAPTTCQVTTPRGTFHILANCEDGYDEIQFFPTLEVGENGIAEPKNLRMTTINEARGWFRVREVEDNAMLPATNVP